MPQAIAGHPTAKPFKAADGAFNCFLIPGHWYAIYSCVSSAYARLVKPNSTTMSNKSHTYNKNKSEPKTDFAVQQILTAELVTNIAYRKLVVSGLAGMTLCS